MPEHFDNPYDAMGELYDLLPALSPYGGITQVDADFYASRARSLETDTVVELGIGTGRVAIPMAQAGFRVFGIDLSSEMKRVSNERAEAAGVADKVHVILDDFAQWELPGRHRAGMVYCPYHSFSHVLTEAERRNVIAHCLDALDGDGELLLSLDFSDGQDRDEHLAFDLDGNHMDITYTQRWDAKTRISSTNIVGRQEGPDGVQERSFDIVLAHLGAAELERIAESMMATIELLTPWPQEYPEDRIAVFRPA